MSNIAMKTSELIFRLENKMFATCDDPLEAYGNLIKVIPENSTAVTVTMLHIFMNSLAKELKNINEQTDGT